MILSALQSLGVSRACAWLFTHCQGSQGTPEATIALQLNRPRLAPQEQRVLALAEHGKTNKQIALELDLSESTVSRAMSRAIKKLQEPQAGVEPIPLPPVALMSRLSRSEREVLVEVLKGYSNQEIAQARSRALRTVANQISKIFIKLGVSSRRTLAARLARVSF